MYNIFHSATHNLQRFDILFSVHIDIMLHNIYSHISILEQYW